MPQPLIVGIVYENDADALTISTRTLCQAFRRAGHNARLIDYRHDADIRFFLKAAQQGAIAFGFGFQGVGARLEAPVGGNLWHIIGRPFICLHHDHPCHNPYNHISDSPFIANLYRFESFCQARRNYLPFPHQLSRVQPICYDLRVPPASPIRWADRQIRFLFVKSGRSLQALEEEARQLPRPLADGLMDIVRLTENDPNYELCDLVAALYRNLGIDRDEHAPQFWADVKWVDVYIRQSRAIRFVEWLKLQEGALIIGSGWDFIDKENARALFKPNQSGEVCARLAWDTQIICNTNPYGRDVVHERVMAGMASGAIILTDTNAWWDDSFKGVESLIRFRWDRPLPSQVEPQLADLRDPEAVIQAGREAAIDRFAPAGIEPFLQVAGEVLRMVPSSR